MTTRSSVPQHSAARVGSASVLVLLLIVLLLPGPKAHAQALSVPGGFSAETAYAGFILPSDFAFAHDGRIFVAEKAGRIRIVQDGRILPTPFADLSDHVNSMFDRGLLGLALHPDFPATPYVYVAYTYEPREAAGHSAEGARTARISRLTASATNSNLALPDSEVVLVGAGGTFPTIGSPDRHDTRPWSCEAPTADRTPYPDCMPADGMAHTVGGLVFGPDGALYAANGDGVVDFSGSMRAQTLESLAGKILRIDPLTGDGYANNPFFDGDVTSNRSKVYAYGMRNPFRFAFHPATGQLVVADVGNNAWEEITVVDPGANLGWPCYEGPERTGISPTCGGLYTGKSHVNPTYSYPHGDGRGAVIGGAFYTGDSFPDRYRNAFFYGDFNGAAIDALFIDASGAAVSASFARQAIAPVQMRTGPDGNLYVLLIAAGSIVRIRYVGDGTASNAVSQPTSLESAPVPGAIPLVTIDQPATDLAVHVGTNVALAGSATEPNGTPISNDRLRWEATLHHNDHTHYDTYRESGASGLLTFADHGDNTYVEVCLVAAGASGSEGRACREIHGTEVTLTVDSDPPDLQLSYEGAVQATPFEVVTYTGARRTVAIVPDPSSDLVFGQWSDGSTEPSRSVDIGATAQRLVAEFSAALGPVTAEAPGVGSPPELPESSDIARADAGEPAVTSMPVVSERGAILREVWTELGGHAVADLVDSDNYATAPDVSELLPVLEAPGAWGNDYGQQLRGYLYPPTSGIYTFWIAADDSGQLWLSPDDIAAHKRLVAEAPAWTGQRQWNKFPEQQSAPIRLEAGERYYIEVIHKEADQKDNLSVAWAVPGQDRAVIAGRYLSPAANTIE